LSALQLAVSADVAFTEIMLRTPVSVLWVSTFSTGTGLPVYIHIYCQGNIHLKQSMKLIKHVFTHNCTIKLQWSLHWNYP